MSKQAVEECQKIMKEEYSQEISSVEVEERGTRLLKFFELLIKVDKKTKISSKK